MAMQEITQEVFKTAVLEAPGLVAVDFWSPMCGHCKKLTPILEELSEEWAGQITMVKIDSTANQDLARELNIRALPTVALYRNGEQIAAIKGFLPKNAMMEKIKAHME